MAVEHEEDGQPIQFTQHRGTTLDHYPARLSIYEVTEETLESLGAGYSSPSLALFTLFIGITLTVFITLLTVPLGVEQFALFGGLSLSGAGLCLLTGSFALRDWIMARKKVAAIKARKHVEA